MKQLIRLICKTRACIYYGVSVLLFVVVVLFFRPESLIVLVSCFGVYAMGVNVVRSYLKNERIDFGWAKVEYDNNPLERLFYFVMALICIALAIIALVSGWE